MQFQHLRPLLHLQNDYCPAGCNISLTDMLSYTSVHNYRLQLWAGLSGWGRTAGGLTVTAITKPIFCSQFDPCLAFLRCMEAKFKMSKRKHKYGTCVGILWVFWTGEIFVCTHKCALESEIKPPRPLKTIKLASKIQTSSQKVYIIRMKRIEGCCRKATVLPHWLKGERTFCRWRVSLAVVFFSARISNKERRLKRQKGRSCWTVWALKGGKKQTMDRKLREGDAEHCVSSWECKAGSESDKTTKKGRISEGKEGGWCPSKLLSFSTREESNSRARTGLPFKDEEGGEVLDQSARGLPTGNDQTLTLTSTADGHQGPSRLRRLLLCCSTFHLSPPFPVPPALLPP